MNIFSKRLAAGSIAAAAAVALLLPAPSTAAENYFKDKTITFVVGFGAGGGYDAYSRMLAPHFARHLGANVIVQNQPGAGGLRALNRFYRAKGDGLSLTIVNGTGAGLQQLVDLEGARFDLTKFGYLGIVDYARWIVLVQPNSKVNNLQQLMASKKQWNWAGSGKISGTTDGAKFACYTLGINCKVVMGYKGSRASALALAQGEMDGLYVSETSAYRYVQAQNAKAIATWNRKRSILFPDLPTVFEQVKLTKEQEWWVDYRATLENLGRILVAPPNTPPELLKQLQDVARKILTDPKIIAEGNKKRRYIKYVEPAEAKKMVLRLLNGVTPEQKARIKKVVLDN